MAGKPGALRQMVDAWEKVGGNLVATEEVPAEKTKSYGIITPGGSDGDLAGAAHGACQQQAGDVGAGDQEQAAYRAQQNVERCAHVAHQKLLHGLNREAHLGIRGAWVPAFELLAGQVEGGFG